MADRERRKEQYRDAMLALIGTHAARVEGRPEDGPTLTEGMPSSRLFTCSMLLFRVATSRLAAVTDTSELEVIRDLARRVSVATILLRSVDD